MKKFLACMLLAVQVCFVLPVRVVFAEEAVQEAPPAVDAAPAQDTASQEGTPSEKSTDNAALGETLGGTPRTGEGTGLPGAGVSSSLHAPTDATKFLQSFQGKQEVDLFSGSLSYTIPVTLPEGRHGLTPRVALSYSSLNSSFGSLVGYGWSLPTNAIFRSSLEGVNTLYSANEFSADIFGTTEELVLVDADTQRYAAKHESAFTSYTFTGSTWTAVDRQGTTYTFGSTDVTRQADPSNTTRVYKWLLERVEDAHGNTIVFEYTQNGEGAVEPRALFYGGTSKEDAPYEVRFTLTDRAAYGEYRTGFLVTHTHLVSDISLVLHESVSEETVFTYHFSYEEQNAAIQELSSFTLSTPTETLPATTFTYYTGNESVPYKKVHALYRIQESSGAEYTLRYTPATAYRATDGVSSVNYLPFTVYVVSELTSRAWAGDEAYTTQYSYAHGHYYADAQDAFVREYAGFGEVTRTDALGYETVQYYHQSENDPDNDTDVSLGEYADDIAKKGRMYREEHYDAAGSLVHATVTTWAAEVLADEDARKSYEFVYPSQVVEMMYLSDGSHEDTAITYAYDAVGNVVQETQWGLVQVDALYACTDVGADARTTVYTYATDAAGKLLGAPSSVTLQDAEGTTVSQTRFLYDELSFGEVITGDVTQQQIWIAGSSYASTVYTYDAYGNVLSQTDPEGNATFFAYDAWSLFPETVTDALAHVTLASYSLAWGVPTRTVAPNGTVYETDYDGFGRPLTERRSSSGDAGVLETTQTWTYADTTSPRSVTHRTFFTPSLFAEEIVYLDGLSRTIETKTKNAEGTGYNERETTYDAQGHVATTTLPETSSSAAFDAHTVSAALEETYGYDALGRQTSVTHVLGSTTTQYGGVTEKTVTDALGNQKVYETDGLGRLVAVMEQADGETYTTSYTWSAADKLTRITDALGNVRNFAFDGRGLRTMAEDVHAQSDTSYGVWNFTYALGGDVTSTLSPEGVATTYAYDALHRVLTEDANTGTGVEHAYTYDTCVNGVGLLCATSTAGGASTAFAYDAAGRRNIETKVLNGTSYTTSFTFDTQGNVLTVTHPEGTVVRNTYNAIGQLATVEEKTVEDAAYVPVVTGYEYGPHGKVTREIYANGTETTYTYSATARYRLTQKVTTGFMRPLVTTTTSTTVTFAPTGGDGSVSYANAVWDTAHDATTGNAASSTNTAATVRTGLNASSAYQIERAAFPFDTSAIPDNATITDATLSVFVFGKQDSDDDGKDFVTLVQSAQASPTALAREDFDLIGAVNTPVEGVDVVERKDLTTITNNAYLSFALNATGLSFISKTGTTQLGVREGHDVLDEAINALPSKANYLFFRTGEYAGTASDPVLTVTYTTDAQTFGDPVSATLQDLSYTYDAVGNIASLVDASSTDTAKTTTYAYDDLYRLLSASVDSAANGANGTTTYAYNALGNITYRSDKGTYTYAGDTLSGSYANPHAVTSLITPEGTTETFSYDHNGNLTSITPSSGSSTSYTWDFANRLTSLTSGSSITSYTYDVGHERLSKTTGTTTTFYPSDAFNVQGTEQTLYLSGPQGSLASLLHSGTSVTLSTLHTDHLGSTAAVTDSSGTLTELLDYNPYGTERLSWSSSSSSGEAETERTYIGEYSDDESGLSYLNARYYDPARGMFLSEDSVYLGMGGGDERDAVLLMDPQQQGSYIYGRGNPVSFLDTSGEEVKVYIERGSIGDGLKAVYGHAFLEVNGTAYSWGPNEGYNNKSRTVDLYDGAIETYLSSSGKNADSYSVYTFDTNTNQDQQIIDYYQNLIKNFSSTPSDSFDHLVFDPLFYNCTDVVTEALQSGGVFSQDFSFGNISTPGKLNDRLSQKYNSQQKTGVSKIIDGWFHGRENGQIMDISSSEKLKTSK